MSPATVGAVVEPGPIVAVQAGSQAAEPQPAAGYASNRPSPAVTNTVRPPIAGPNSRPVARAVHAALHGSVAHPPAGKAERPPVETTNTDPATTAGGDPTAPGAPADHARASA